MNGFDRERKDSISFAASSNISEIRSGFPSCTLLRELIWRRISARLRNLKTISCSFIFKTPYRFCIDAE